MTELVNRHGFFEDENLVFLLEGEEERCLNPGLEGLDSPFRAPKNLPCRHKLWTPSPGEVSDHPLVKAIAPVRQAGSLYWVHRSQERNLRLMSQMFGENPDACFLSWGVRTDRITLSNAILEIRNTNAVPLIVLDYQPRDYNTLQKLIYAPRFRNVIFCGPYRLAGCIDLDNYEDNIDLDWRKMGASFTYEYVRKVSNGT